MPTVTSHAIRAALAGKMLKDLGYDKVFNMGGFKDWADSGGAVDK